MIKIDNTQVFGFEGAIRGMRNPFESWSRSDSFKCEHPLEHGCVGCGQQLIDDRCITGEFVIGKADMELCKKLIKAGSEHRKFLRFIHVQADVVAPRYWISELVTYKIGTTMNSSSLQHLGAKREYTIRDFSIDDERIYEILDWKPTDHKSKHPLILSENGADEYKLYTCGEREYKVFKNGRIVRCAFDVEDKGMNRIRHFDEKEIKYSQSPEGYYYCNLRGRGFSERWMVHRLVAMLWHPDTFNPKLTVNHIDHQKGNNHADNLEWITLEDNVKDQNENKLNKKTLHASYLAFKASSKTDLSIIYKIREEYNKGVSCSEIARNLGISQGYCWSIINDNYGLSENRELFIRCYMWEKLIDELNRLRELYNETKDYEYFRTMRQLIPMSFNYHITLDFNYETLLNIYRQRKNHNLSEWSGENGFCTWIINLPYMNEFLEDFA